MHALTVHQPYATLIVRGLKRIEWRSWPCPKGLVGERLIVHAGKRQHQAVLERALRDWPDLASELDGGGFPTSAILGTVRIVECVHMHKAAFGFVEPTELSYGDPNAAYAWLLDEPEAYDHPLRAINGAQGLWPIGR